MGSGFRAVNVPNKDIVLDLLLKARKSLICGFFYRREYSKGITIATREDVSHTLYGTCIFSQGTSSLFPPYYFVQENPENGHRKETDKVAGIEKVI